MLIYFTGRMTADLGLNLAPRQQERVNGQGDTTNTQTSRQYPKLWGSYLSVKLVNFFDSSSDKCSKKREQCDGSRYGVRCGERKGGRKVTLDIECICCFIVE